jgi:hypothetical protein
LPYKGLIKAAGPGASSSNKGLIKAAGPGASSSNKFFADALNGIRSD